MQCRNPWSSTSAWHWPTDTSGHRSQIQPPLGQALQLGQACCAGLREPRVPKQTCHESFTHNHLASIFSSCSQSQKAPCDHGAPWDLGQDQHFPTEQSCKEPHKQRVLQGFSLWRAGAGGVTGCQQGGCRREAPVHNLCCQLFPRSQAPLCPPQRQRQRIIELFGWERTFKGCPVQFPAESRDIFS